MNPEYLQTDRLLLSRMSENYPWSIVSNSKWDHSTRLMSDILNNCFNKYVEYYNCGVKYRMIRINSIQDYDIKIEEIKPEWILYLKDCET